MDPFSVGAFSAGLLGLGGVDIAGLNNDLWSFYFHELSPFKSWLATGALVMGSVSMPAGVTCGAAPGHAVAATSGAAGMASASVAAASGAAVAGTSAAVTTATAAVAGATVAAVAREQASIQCCNRNLVLAALKHRRAWHLVQHFHDIRDVILPID